MTASIKMYARKRFDIGWGSLVAGLGFALGPQRREERERAVEAHFEAAGPALACLSVRSGFDALLGSVDWPAGSEVLMTAITIPAMTQIVREHGYVPVAVDVDIESAGPTVEAVAAATGPKTRAVVVAHLFGTRVDLAPLAELARTRGVMLIEDCAQAYEGRVPAASVADISMFSFGTIKTATALGGAVMVVRDAALLQAMRQAQQRYPVQSSRGFALKVLKYMALVILSYPRVYGVFARVIEAQGRDHDAFIREMTRGFSGPNFFKVIRQRPCGGQLGLLATRQRRYDAERVRERAACGRAFAALLSPGVRYFGDGASEHTYWLFALVLENPTELIAALRLAGFDATQGSSTLAVIETALPEALSVTQAREAIKRVVYLPLYPEVPGERRREMASIINRHVQSLASAETRALNDAPAA